MPIENTAQRYLADILVAVNKLNERYGSTIKSIINYIRQNRIKKNTNPRTDLLNQRIKRNIQSAVQLKLLKRANGKYRLLEDIKSGGKSLKYCGVRRGRGKRKSRSPNRQNRLRRPRRSGSRKRRRDGHPQSISDLQIQPSGHEIKVKTEKVEEQPKNKDADDGKQISNNNSNC